MAKKVFYDDDARREERSRWEEGGRIAASRFHAAEQRLKEVEHERDGLLAAQADYLRQIEGLQAAVERMNGLFDVGPEEPQDGMVTTWVAAVASIDTCPYTWVDPTARESEPL